MSTVCVIGLGYIGLPVAAMLASRGHEVVGFDVNPTAVESINNGRSHFVEPDLDMLLSAAVQTGRLRAQAEPVEADYFVIAVPTPFGAGHKPDLSYVDTAISSIAPYLRRGATVILESTSPVGTTERIADQLQRLRSDLRLPRYKDPSKEADIFVSHCPERILPGQMVRELTTNDRIIGGMTEQCAVASQALYESFVNATCLLTDCRTAEFVKLIENAYRDVNIAFANELSIICDRLGIDVWSAIELANRHPRVSILSPGAGVGGHCIAVDPWFIVDSAPEESRLIRTAREVNDLKPNYVVQRILTHADRFKKPTVACLGITYKPDVEDLRESPSLEIVKHLSGVADVRILVSDPMVQDLVPELRGVESVSFASVDEAIRQADIIAILVAHSQFKKLASNNLLNKVVIDIVGLLAPNR